MADDPHDDVRARLAAEPSPSMPNDVAARLHDALAAEARSRQSSSPSEPDEGQTPATVTELPRRGRWKAPLLAAAGVVAVIAIGIPVINQTSNQSNGDGGAADSSSGALQSDSAQEAPEAGSSDQSEQSDQTEPQGRAQGMVKRFRQAPMDLDGTRFRSDLSAYLGDRARSSAPPALKGDVSAVVSCKGGRPSAPGGLQATLDGDPAVVLIAPVAGGVRARAVVCGDAGPTVAARALLD